VRERERESERERHYLQLVGCHTPQGPGGPLTPATPWGGCSPPRKDPWAFSSCSLVFFSSAPSPPRGSPLFVFCPPLRDRCRRRPPAPSAPRHAPAEAQPPKKKSLAPWPKVRQGVASLGFCELSPSSNYKLRRLFQGFRVVKTIRRWTYSTS
jgi:hypothetical protein